MAKHKFKIGDQIECIYQGKGFEKATVISIFTEKEGINKGKKMYLLKIVNGKATMPISAEVNYKIRKA